jgi:hypothetical protein
MAAMCPALRCRTGALVCWGAFVVLNVFFVVGYNSHDRPSAIGICMLDAILLIAGTLLYRRGRRLTPASPLSKHYQVD